MNDILDNAKEFEESAEDNIKKERWNAASADLFKVISNLSDYLIYSKIKRLPKNHSERFELLKKYFADIYERSIKLFETYRKSYNFKLTKEEALKLREYTNELKEFVKNKK